VRFGRKADKASDGEDTPGTTGAPLDGAGGDALAAEEPRGPFDETDVDTEDREGVDLGSLMVSPTGPMEMRLQVDEQSGDVMAVVLVAEQGALELRAFAASRGGGAWDELRPRIAAETSEMGGTATEGEGPFGPDLRCTIPVQTEEGEQATQVSRVMGHEGPRWLLRATLMGPPALEETVPEVWEETIRQTVVRRGRDAMAPGSALPLHLPPEARRVE